LDISRLRLLLLLSLGRLPLPDLRADHVCRISDGAEQVVCHLIGIPLLFIRLA
jgi:hypothetical protein